MNQQQTPLPSIRKLILVPALITLVVTGLRLALELGAAPSWLANSGEGGLGALVGIVWLPLIFGPYFAARIRPHAADSKTCLKHLAKTLFVYGLTARIPVILITIPALLGEWGTHYEKFPFEVDMAGKILATLGAQLIFWATIWTILSGLTAAWIVRILSPGRTAAAAS
jgi:hypothetical protein